MAEEGNSVENPFGSVNSAEVAEAGNEGGVSPPAEESFGAAGAGNNSISSSNSNSSSNSSNSSRNGNRRANGAGRNNGAAAPSLTNLALAPGEAAEEDEEEEAAAAEEGGNVLGNLPGAAAAAAAAAPKPAASAAPVTKGATQTKEQKQAEEAEIRGILKSKGLPTGLVWVPRFAKFRREKGADAFQAKIAEFERRKDEPGINPVALGLVSQAEVNARTAQAARNRERRGASAAPATAVSAAPATKAKTAKKANGNVAAATAAPATKAKTAKKKPSTAGFNVANLQAELEAIQKRMANLEAAKAAAVEKARREEEAAAARAAREAETAAKAAGREAFEKARSNLKRALGGANASNSFVSAFMSALEGKNNLTPDLFAQICGKLNKTRKERKNKGVSRKAAGSAASGRSGSSGSAGSRRSSKGAAGAAATTKKKAAASKKPSSLEEKKKALKAEGINVKGMSAKQIREAYGAGVY